MLGEMLSNVGYEIFIKGREQAKMGWPCGTDCGWTTLEMVLANFISQFLRVVGSAKSKRRTIF